MSCGTCVLQHESVGSKDADRNRDERERDREHLKGAERPFQLRLVATLFAEIVGSRCGSETSTILDISTSLGGGLIGVFVQA